VADQIFEPDGQGMHRFELGWAWVEKNPT